MFRIIIGIARKRPVERFIRIFLTKALVKPQNRNLLTIRTHFDHSHNEREITPNLTVMIGGLQDFSAPFIDADKDNVQQHRRLIITKPSL